MSGSVRKQFLVSDDNVAKLDALEAAEGVSASEIVRRAIDAYNVSEDDAELDRLVSMMSESIQDAVKEVRAARKLVRQANREYAERKAS